MKWLVCIGLLLGFSVSGCNTEGSRADFQLQLAPSDSTCTVEDSGSLTGEIVVRICPSAGGDCVALAGESELLRVAVDSFESEPIDIADTSELMKVDVQVCQGQDVVAFAGAPQVRLQSGVSLVLHKVQSTSCGARLLPRAFGYAVALPSGKVLVFGGVDVVLSRMKDEVAAMVETVEVYDPATDTSRTLSGSFSGALGTSFHVSSQGNLHTVRVLGGLEADPGAAAFQFSRATDKRAAFFGLPIQPTEATRYAAVRELVYDSAAQTVVVEELSGDELFGVGETAFNVGTDELATFGVGASGEPVGRGARIASGGTLELFDMQVKRLGNSVTDMGDGSAFIWGGPILEPPEPSDPPQPPANIGSFAGEDLNLVTLTSSLVAAPVVEDEEEKPEVPTSFHEATSLVSGQLLLAGGVESICDETCQLKVSQVYAARPLRVVTLDGSLIPVGGTPISPAIFQASATTADAWLVAGGTGAIVSAEATQFTFEPTGQVTVVTEDRGSYSARPLTPLREPRFGHTMVALTHGPSVVFGGIRTSAGGLGATGGVEWVVAGPTENLCALESFSP